MLDEETRSFAASGLEPGVDAAYALRFEGDNSFPDCACCGRCCDLNVICASAEEVVRMRAYIAEHDVVPIDKNAESCCLKGEDGRCMIWEERPQICRLHNCHVPRSEILRINPSIIVDDDIPLIDLHDAFILGDFSDPRFRPPTGHPHAR